MRMICLVQYYTDDTYTAAVSHILYEAWPGSAAVDTDRTSIFPYFIST